MSLSALAQEARGQREEAVRAERRVFTQARNYRKRLYVFAVPAHVLIQRALTAPAVELAEKDGVILGIREKGRTYPHKPKMAAKRDPSGRIDAHYRITRKEWLEMIERGE